MNEVAYSLQGHTEAITSLTLSADGAFVLTNSLDNSLRIWDVRPFAAAQRCTKVCCPSPVVCLCCLSVKSVGDVCR